MLKRIIPKKIGESLINLSKYVTQVFNTTDIKLESNVLREIMIYLNVTNTNQIVEIFGNKNNPEKPLDIGIEFEFVTVKNIKLSNLTVSLGKVKVSNDKFENAVKLIDESSIEKLFIKGN